MSVNFVTKKLEGQTLGDQLNDIVEKVQEDSGTESDEDIELTEGESDNVDSGISLNLRSAARLGGRSRQLTPLAKEPVAVFFSETMIVGEDNDNHSSEEELEDIIGSARKKVYVNGTVPTATKTAPGRMSAVEKRKWSEVEQGARTGSGSSADEEVSELMEGVYTPVQFCTSPPLNVYKPRRSQSPPPKLFHMAPSGVDQEQALGTEQRPANQTNLREGQRSAGAFRPRVRGSGVLVLRGQEEDDEGEERSPNKRHRTTPRPHNIPRPSLDFEKMQQIKTKVVTSWRQGAELSLFCW